MLSPLVITLWLTLAAGPSEGNAIPPTQELRAPFPSTQTFAFNGGEYVFLKSTVSRDRERGLLIATPLGQDAACLIIRKIGKPARAIRGKRITLGVRTGEATVSD